MTIKYDIRLWLGSDILPTCEDYKRYLDEAVKQLKISREEARSKYGKFTYKQWKQLLITPKNITTWKS